MPKIDYDLRACFENNVVPGIGSVYDITDVLAVWEGRNDDGDWRWVVRLNDGRHAYIRAGCDYTGWDCQSWVHDVVISSLPIFTIGGENIKDIREDLRDQIVNGKAETWREEMDAKLGVES